MEVAAQRVEAINDLCAGLLGSQAEIVARDVERKLVVLNQVLVVGKECGAGGPVEPSGSRLMNANLIGARLELRGVQTERRLHRIEPIGGRKFLRSDLLAIDEHLGAEARFEFMARA